MALIEPWFREVDFKAVAVRKAPSFPEYVSSAGPYPGSLQPRTPICPISPLLPYPMAASTVPVLFSCTLRLMVTLPGGETGTRALRLQTGLY